MEWRNERIDGGMKKDGRMREGWKNEGGMEE